MPVHMSPDACLACRFAAAKEDFARILELRPKHSSASKEIEDARKGEEAMAKAKAAVEVGDNSTAMDVLDKQVLAASPDCKEVRGGGEGGGGRLAGTVSQVLEGNWNPRVKPNGRWMNHIGVSVNVSQRASERNSSLNHSCSC